jgi:hypothetical protein
MGGLASQITRGEKPVCSELLLHSQIPVVNGVGIHVIRHGKVHCARRKLGVGIRNIRKWISAGIISPWIVEAPRRAVHSDITAPWRSDCTVDEKLAVHEIV